jgi:Cu/Zn superoxide dismutase
LVLGGTGVASGALSNILKIQGFSEDLTMTPATTMDEVFDSTRAKITVEKETDSTSFTIRLTGIDPSVADATFGSHLHTGPCVEGNPGSAGPHYNHQVVVDGKAFPKLGETPSATIAEVSPDTEVWFDLVPNEDGMAYDETTVPFVPVDPEGGMSVVVHVLPTNTKDNYPTLGGAAGSAGTRQACFPVNVSQLFPTEPPAPAE